MQGYLMQHFFIELIYKYMNFYTKFVLIAKNLFSHQQEISLVNYDITIQ